MYSKEIINMGVRLGHIPDFLIKETIKSNYKFIFFYGSLVLFLFAIFAMGIVILNETESIMMDLIGASTLIVAFGSFVIVNIFSIETVYRSMFDVKNLAIEMLISEQLDFEFNNRLINEV